MTDPALPGCLFCDAVAGEEPCSPVYEDPSVLSFLDLQPLTTGERLDEELGAHVFRVGHRLARAPRRGGVPCEGVSMYLHLHVFPRTQGDSFRIQADWLPRPRSELDETAARIRHALRGSPA